MRGNCSAPGCPRPAPEPQIYRGSLEPGGGAWRRPLDRERALLQLDGGACLLELGLDAVGLLLVDALLDRLRSRVDEVLRLLQAEARDGADDLDHLDLLAAGLRED